MNGSQEACTRLLKLHQTWKQEAGTAHQQPGSQSSRHQLDAASVASAQASSPGSHSSRHQQDGVCWTASAQQVVRGPWSPSLEARCQHLELCRAWPEGCNQLAWAYQLRQWRRARRLVALPVEWARLGARHALSWLRAHATSACCLPVQYAEVREARRRRRCQMEQGG